MSNIKDGPMKHLMESSTEGVVYEEYTRYVKRKDINQIVKVTATRKWIGTDYIDSLSTIPLHALNEKSWEQ